MEGTIFDIQHFCTHDGPGIRTTVFLKGCPLHCSWCHNPESQKAGKDILANPMKCIGCLTCERVCPAHDSHHILQSSELRRKHCNGCLLCAENCPAAALEIAGRTATVEQIIEEVLQDRDYYESTGGGMTLSGGEPMAQADFTVELLKRAKDHGIQTAVETSGSGSLDKYRTALEYLDLLIWDVKLIDEDLYREHIGTNYRDVLQNIRTLRQEFPSRKFLLRYLFIPELHLQKNVLKATAEFAAANRDVDSEVIPYHLLGNSKREKLGLEKRIFREPTDEEKAIFARIIEG